VPVAIPAVSTIAPTHLLGTQWDKALRRCFLVDDGPALSKPLAEAAELAGQGVMGLD